MSLDLIQELNKLGIRAFSIDTIRKLAANIGISKKYVPRLLSKLIKQGIILHIVKGKYALSNNLISGSPLHQFEVASQLAEDPAVSYWSAFVYHGLSDQIVRKTYLISFCSNSHPPYSKIYKVGDQEYHIIKTNIANKWGIQRQFIDEILFYVTDLERTLLDGLSKPQYCGGMREVMHSFAIAKNKIDLAKICDYVLDHCSLVVARRLGFILQYLGIDNIFLAKLSDIPIKTYQKLDPMGKRLGTYNKKWMLIENI